MILVVNAGSSSLKLALFDGPRETAQAEVERIGAGGPATHADALPQGLDLLGPHPITAAAHRVVHGGASLTQACRLTPQVEARIDALSAIAPLHNPPALSAIRAVRARWPDLAQFASFDTAFHATNPDVATAFALPAEERARGLRRYGFHGLSYAALIRSRTPVPQRLLAFHLGNGASACAILDGRSVASSMGYSPLDGLTMGTRAGALDPAVVLDLAARHGVDGAMRLLNRESGLKALGGSNDMRSLHGAGTAQAQFAIDHFAYWAARHGASLIAAMGGITAVAFTGGIGENDPVTRAKILDHLAWTGLAYDPQANAANAPDLHSASSAVAIWTVPAQEERQIAVEATEVMRREQG